MLFLSLEQAVGLVAVPVLAGCLGRLFAIFLLWLFEEGNAHAQGRRPCLVGARPLMNWHVCDMFNWQGARAMRFVQLDEQRWTTPCAPGHIRAA